jgi:uncharacterized membrane protein HdeD (DUF308 family)
MTADNQPGSQPGDRVAAPDPAYRGAVPGAATAESWGHTGFTREAENRAMSALLAQNWWAIALRGVFAILFGVLAILLPGVTLGSLVLLFGIYMLVDGAFDIVAGIRAATRHDRWGGLVLEAIIDFIAGAIALFWPIATIFAFVLLMAAWAIISGIALLVATFRLHVSHGRWLMGVGGVVSIVWGILLAIAPAIGAIVLTWWIGGYALFFGAALLGLAFRLRRRHHEQPRRPPRMMPLGA